MKRILLALATLALFLPSAPRAEGRVGVSIDFFYNNLDGGSWIEVGDYGYCWQPSIAVSNPSWRPYADGYWAYTDLGWTWVSYEDFGWATYHYGRWARLRHHGWVWVPGYEWGPAWVSWRTGGDYVGWAPLPPRRYGHGGEVVYTGRAIGSSVDIEFDIGPMYYNFVDVRYIGAPVLREHIYAPSQNITYINQTVNVTNITYNNSTVYNYGPDYNRLSAYSARPIQRLTLQREAPADLSAAADSGALTKVQGDKLIVTAPTVMEKPEQPVAPPNVKTKVETPDIETGWMGISDPNAKAQIQEKMKKEDPKSVPPPKVARQNPDASNAAAPAGTPDNATASAPGQSEGTTSDAPTTARDRRGNGKGKQRADQTAPSAQPQEVDGSTPPQPADAAAASVADDDQRGRGRNKDRRGRDRVQPATPPEQPGTDTPANVTAPAADPASPAAQDQPRGRKKRDGQVPPSVRPPVDPAPAGPVGAPPDAAVPSDVVRPQKERREGNKKNRGDNDDRRGRGSRQPDLQPPPQAPDRGLYVPNAGVPSEDDGGNRGRGRQKRERVDVPQRGPAPDIAPPPQAAPREVIQQERGRGRRERQEPPPNIAPPPQADPAAGGPPPETRQGRGKPERGDKKKKKDDE